ncbi:MAG TPA: hypothetical protein VKG85_04540 [Actinomycetes bacterium]|nr:hypothetical protein [Actinomycetes bacterium]
MRCTVAFVRWEELFADLTAEFEALESADLAAEVSDRTRRELARIRLVDRLRAAASGAVVVTVQTVNGGQTISGRLLDVGPDWLLVERADAPVEVLIPLAAVGTVIGLPSSASEPGSEGHVRARLGLAHVLRGIARDRAAVCLAIGGAPSLTGTIDRVGADYFDLAEHAPDEPRRAGNVRAVRTVPFTAVLFVQRAIAG